MKIIVIDTNIFICYLIRDDEVQYQVSRKIIKQIEAEAIKGIVSLLVIHEIVWVLENYYDLKRIDFVSKLLHVMALKNLHILEVKKATLVKIIGAMESSNLDFTDLYLFHTSAGRDIMTFDKELKKYRV